MALMVFRVDIRLRAKGILHYKKVKRKIESTIINIQNLIDEEKCYKTVREIRWQEEVNCPHCNSKEVVKNGFSDEKKVQQRYVCKKCHSNFDDLTNTIFANHHQPLSKWILCLYFMGLNLSNCQIAKEPELNVSDCQEMTTLLGEAVFNKNPKVILTGEVEFDEVYVAAGHKGHPEAVKVREPRGSRLKGARGRGTLESEKPPIFGMIQRGGEVIIQMLSNVKKLTINPIISRYVAEGSTVYTDEYNIYSGLEKFGYKHKTVCHSKGEYARDDDNDGFCEVHVNTMEGFRSLLRSWLRSWLRPHRGISQEALPIYPAFFRFIHNSRKRGKALLDSLLGLLLI